MLLGESFDVVEAIRLLAAEAGTLREAHAVLEARVEVLEGKRAPRPLLQVGDLVAEPEAVAGAVGRPMAKPARPVKGEAAGRCTDQK